VPRAGCQPSQIQHCHESRPESGKSRPKSHRPAVAGGPRAPAYPGPFWDSRVSVTQWGRWLSTTLSTNAHQSVESSLGWGLPRDTSTRTSGAAPVISRRTRFYGLVFVGFSVLIASVTVLGSHYAGHGLAARTLASAAQPLALSSARTSTPARTTPRSDTSRSDPSRSALSRPASPTVSPTVVSDRPGIPLQVIVADHHVLAPVTADPLRVGGSFFVPGDPRAVSWSRQSAGPGSSSGTAILVGRTSFGGAPGAFSDLAGYRVGQIVTVELADGRRMKYVVDAKPLELTKGQVGPRRVELFDQSKSYGLAGRPKSGRLLLLGCSGALDNVTGLYETNVLVYALPV
jgi:hypothetical protein